MKYEVVLQNNIILVPHSYIQRLFSLAVFTVFRVYKVAAAIRWDEFQLKKQVGNTKRKSITHP